MILRLILVLLAACLPLPAAAAPCHVAVATHGHHAPQKPEPVAPMHVCVGCVPLGDWLRAPLAAPVMPIAPLPETRVARLDLGRASPPVLPPPRGA